jgi:hypothetical protein
MSVPAAALLFCVSASSVFMQAFQSRNVNQGHFIAAALTSLVIGIAQTISLKMVPDASEIGSLLYILGGPVGVVAGMFVHSRTLGRSKATEAADDVDNRNIDVNRPATSMPSTGAPQ